MVTIIGIMKEISTIAWSSELEEVTLVPEGWAAMTLGSWSSWRALLEPRRALCALPIGAWPAYGLGVPIVPGQRGRGTRVAVGVDGFLTLDFHREPRLESVSRVIVPRPNFMRPRTGRSSVSINVAVEIVFGKSKYNKS